MMRMDLNCRIVAVSTLIQLLDLLLGQWRCHTLNLDVDCLSDIVIYFHRVVRRLRLNLLVLYYVFDFIQRLITHSSQRQQRCYLDHMIHLLRSWEATTQGQRRYDCSAICIQWYHSLLVGVCQLIRPLTCHRESFLQLGGCRYLVVLWKFWSRLTGCGNLFLRVVHQLLSDLIQIEHALSGLDHGHVLPWFWSLGSLCLFDCVWVTVVIRGAHSNMTVPIDCARKLWHLSLRYATTWLSERLEWWLLDRLLNLPILWTPCRIDKSL